MTPAEVLRKAADVIREQGHCKGVYSTEDGRVCVYGAINTAAGHWPVFEGDDYVVDTACRTLMRHLDYDVVYWNDAPERTAEEVIAALEKAAELAETK